MTVLVLLPAYLIIALTVVTGEAPVSDFVSKIDSMFSKYRHIDTCTRLVLKQKAFRHASRGFQFNETI